MSLYLAVIIVILLGNYFLTFAAEALNIFSAASKLPPEFEGFYDAAKYRKAQEYLRENTFLKIFQATFFTLTAFLFIIYGGFNFVDQLARSFDLEELLTGLVFAGILFAGLQVLELPFSFYRTFVIEEKYGFNRTSYRTFFFDLLKSWFLATLIGAVVLALTIFFFMKAGPLAWVWCWIGVSAFEIFLLFVAPIFIFPLFNKFIPLGEGQLKQQIQEYAFSQNFKMKGLFTMDGSRRSSKANAFFVGFGKYRRIVLYDTLIKQHTTEELVSVLAHEMGHYKKKHILKGIILTFFTTGLMFFVLSLFITQKELFAAFKMQEISVYAGLCLFAFLYTPINVGISILSNALSRRHEYEADRYAVLTYNKPQAFILALKKLTVNTLSNLTPHPLKVFLSYSHPPILLRIKAIRALERSLDGGKMSQNTFF
ncbi:MAG: M48 family metallopeptidase [Candidatus Omnitrophica bacterium]|nr:M48 family metallopeptidase [Candidatus Omnitrophota bacterium]MDD5429740.1 M48 family metallopeptidase [Candidatus Omnitrophota bacterium]